MIEKKREGECKECAHSDSSNEIVFKDIIGDTHIIFDVNKIEMVITRGVDYYVFLSCGMAVSVAEDVYADVLEQVRRIRNDRV